MKQTILVVALTLIFSCTSHKTHKINDGVSTQDTVSDYLLQDNSVNNLVKANHEKLNNTLCGLNSFKLYLGKLDDNNLASIPFALDYVNTCISTNDPDRDSIFVLFNIKFNAVLSKLSEPFNTKYKFLINQIKKDSSSITLKSFRNNLASCGIDIFFTEGFYYPDMIPNYFCNNFKNRVSEGLREYLKIRKDELECGFSEDAAMQISFEDLYKRIKRWELFLNKYPNTVYREEANSEYANYLRILIQGQDNSSIFDYKDSSLLPEIKLLFERIIKEESESPTSQIISSYYSFLLRHDFKYNDSIQVFLNTNNLLSLLSIRPSENTDQSFKNYEGKYSIPAIEPLGEGELIFKVVNSMLIGTCEQRVLPMGGLSKDKYEIMSINSKGEGKYKLFNKIYSRWNELLQENKEAITGNIYFFDDRIEIDKTIYFKIK